MSKAKKTETKPEALLVPLDQDNAAVEQDRTPKPGGLMLVMATGPGGPPKSYEADLKILEAMGHRLAPPFMVQTDDGAVPVADHLSNICHIMGGTSHPVDGVLVCPDWVACPRGRSEVFAAVNMDLKLCALGTNGALVELDQWAVLMTLASHPRFKEAAAIYAPLPSRAG